MNVDVILCVKIIFRKKKTNDYCTVILRNTKGFMLFGITIFNALF